MRGRSILGLILAFSLTASLWGCGEAPRQETAAGEVALLEPVGLTSSGEAAARRNLYDASIYSATVVPYVEEYAFEEDVILDGFRAFPGEAVAGGQVLAASNTEDLDKQIEEQQERIENMEKEFVEYELQMQEDLEKPQEEVKGLRGIVEGLEKRKPAEYLDPPSQSVSGSDSGSSPSEPEEDGTETGPVTNPAYSEWEKEYNHWNGQYRIADHRVNTMLLQLEQRRALYELDHAYALQQLAFLQEKKSDVTVRAGMGGHVVAVAEYGYRERLQGETSIVAVGDLEQKLLKSDYINRKTASSAEELYAVIDGMRYEVEYVPMESEEYTRLSTQGEEVYSTLYLQGDLTNVNVGDYAAIVVVNRKQEQALSVPAEAIHKDDTGSYVYVVNGDENIYTPVRVGMSDGVYTEILSGIGEGDVVRLDQGRQYSDKRVTVERGSFYSSFSGSGMMYYPSSAMVTNPITHGTVYFQEFQTSMYQHVEKGDVIATVRVAADEIGLERLLLQVQRQQERVQDLIEQGEEINRKAIESRLKTIAELQEQIADENTCYVVLEDKSHVLSYGNQVKVTYHNREEQERETMGLVANVNRLAVSKSLQSEFAYILLPPEVIGDMSLGTAGWGGWWNMTRYGVEAKLREMDHVLVVPRSAVREINGRPYVNVVEADGSIVRRSFIAGGYDKSNYWVVEGLTEGMELCLE